MDPNDPILTDASTVHRAPSLSRREESDQADGTQSEVRRKVGNVSQVGESEAAKIAEARTVIRGSSRIDSKPAKRLDQTPASVAQVLLGTRLNHFHLEEMIGGGGMGAVFRARDEQLDRIVAIKVIPFVGNDPELQRRFRNEAQSAAKLDHPQIARVFEVGSHDEWHYIVFEYIRGTNIRDLVHSSGVLSIDDAVFFTSQLAEALQHAADRGIVHRDIKPSNVLIGQDDKIKLVDMGLARSDSFDLSEDMTASGVTLGTFDYISPEQARDPRVADLRSDIYSLGCTLYFMLTGSPPYPGGTMLQKLLSHGNSPPPDARLLRPQVSDDLVIVINKMLAKDPENRYASGFDLISDLREVAFRDRLKRSQGIPAVSISEPNRIVMWFEHHAPWLIATTLLLVSLAWLQLVSTASRNEFDLTVPSTAMVMRDTESTNRSDMTDQNLVDPTEAKAESETTSLDNGLALNPANPGALDSESDSNFRSAESVNQNSFAAPPRMVDVSIPTELDADLENSIFTDPSSERDSAVSETNPLPRTDASVIAPRLVRVIAGEPTPEQRNGENGIAFTTTLADAIAIAKEHQLYRIEIASPVIQSGPIRIDQDGLLITVADNLQECIIEMQHQDRLAMQRLRMIDIGSNQIDFEDVHFVWKIAGGEFDGGALMTISDNRLVRMTDCTITIDNPSRLDAIYAFEVVAMPEASEGQSSRASLNEPGQSNFPELPLVAIELNNVIIRGQMTMIHMKQAVELQLQWENGLLAISQRMIDTMGSSFQPGATASAMQFSLTRLTALIPQGLVRMRLGVEGQFPIAIDREAESCVFVVDEGTPHVEVSGLSNFDDKDSLLKLRGEANAYDVQPTFVDPFLLLSDNQGNVQITRMQDLRSDPPSWSDEASPRWQVRWASPRFKSSTAESATNRLKVDDFLQYGTVVSGFNAGLLPDLPVKNDPLQTPNDRF